MEEKHSVITDNFDKKMPLETILDTTLVYKTSHSISAHGCQQS